MAAQLPGPAWKLVAPVGEGYRGISGQLGMHCTARNASSASSSRRNCAGPHRWPRPRRASSAANTAARFRASAAPDPVDTTSSIRAARRSTLERTRADIFRDRRHHKVGSGPPARMARKRLPAIRRGAHCRGSHTSNDRTSPVESGAATRSSTTSGPCEVWVPGPDVNAAQSGIRVARAWRST